MQLFTHGSDRLICLSSLHGGQHSPVEIIGFRSSPTGAHIAPNNEEAVLSTYKHARKSSPLHPRTSISDIIPSSRIITRLSVQPTGRFDFSVAYGYGSTNSQAVCERFRSPGASLRIEGRRYNRGTRLNAFGSRILSNSFTTLNCGSRSLQASGRI